MIPYSWLIFYNKYFMVILWIYNTLNIDVLQIKLFLKINKYELKSTRINIS